MNAGIRLDGDVYGARWHVSSSSMGATSSSMETVIRLHDGCVELHEGRHRAPCRAASSSMEVVIELHGAFIELDEFANSHEPVVFTEAATNRSTVTDKSQSNKLK